MSDGEASDPSSEIDQIMNKFGTKIVKSWVIPYG